MKNLLLLVLSTFTLFTHSISAQDQGDRIIGIWEPSNGKARVKIEKIGTRYYGKIVWLKEPNDPETGKPKQDKNHPEEATRTRPVLGMINIWGFTYKETNLWDDGNIYDPKNGSTYSCTIKMINPNTLEVRGYIGVSIIGRTDTWTRQQAK